MQARGFVRRSRDLLHKLSKLFTTASHTTNNYSRLPLRGNDSILFIQNAEIIAQPVMRFNLRKINIEMSRPFRANNCHVLRCMFNTFCNLTIFRCLSSDKLQTRKSYHDSVHVKLLIRSSHAIFRLQWRCFPFIGANRVHQHVNYT